MISPNAKFSLSVIVWSPFLTQNCVSSENGTVNNRSLWLYLICSNPRLFISPNFDKKSCTSFDCQIWSHKWKIYLFLHLIVEDKEIADDLTGAANGHARLIPEEDAEVAAELTEQPPAEPEEKKPDE